MHLTPAQSAGDEFFQRSGGDFAIYKDPNANKDYTVLWSDWLADAGGDTIASVVYVVDAGITQTDQSNTATDSVIWLSGGELNHEYYITHRITTAGGRIEDQSFWVLIKDK